MKSAILVLICLAGVSVFSGAQPINIAKADSIAELYPGHSLSDLGTLSQKLTGSLTNDSDKFRAIYKWVCLNISCDYGMMELNRKKLKTLKREKLERWKKHFSEQTIQTLIDERRTVCTGYAWLVRELALRAGIRCEMVYGYGRTPRINVRTAFLNHTWNAAQLDGKWYLCDAAWSGGVIDGATKVFQFKYIDRYFLMEPSQFILNHYPVDSKWTLIEVFPTLDAFLNAPLAAVR